MILILSTEENEILRGVSDIGLSAQTLMSYMLDVFGCVQIVVQEECTKKEETESIGEVIAVPEDEEQEEAEA